MNLRKMKPLTKGLALGLIHILLVTGMAGKYLYDRATRARVWVRTAPIDPDLPIRGRYVRLQLAALEARGFPHPPPDESFSRRRNWTYSWATLSVEESKLIAVQAEPRVGHQVRLRMSESGAIEAMLVVRLAFFIPEHVPDPSRRAPGGELWVEVTIPRKGPPRPIRLGVKKEGLLTPLDLD